ncbi:MAG: esterase-like activity of phytase family protein [Pseudomonadota bacterium]
MKTTPLFLGLVLVALALLLPGAPIGVFSDRFAGGDASSAGEAAGLRPLSIVSKPVDVPADLLDGLEPAGAWHLSSTNPWFGGFSGLLIEDGRIIAVTDKAQLLRARYALDGDQLKISEATLWHLRDADDRLLDYRNGDAESLARQGDHLLISFEREHRIDRLLPDGRLSPFITGDELGDLSNNGGVEAMVVLPDDSILAIAESPVNGAAPVWLIRNGKIAIRTALPYLTDHLVTGATLDREGRLLLTMRHYSVQDGVSIRIVSYQLDGGIPVPESGTVIAAFEHASGIDNMEGITTSTDAAGNEILWLISDDNFNKSQRTLLMRFRLLFAG